MNYPPYRVVGVVGDLYGDRISDGVVKMLYFPLLAESPAGPIGPAAPYKPPIPLNPTGMHFIVDADAPMSALLPAIRKIVRDADPKVPVTDVTPMAAITAGATAQTRLMMVLLSTAAAAALLLSAIGLYSVIAYAVAGRRREFGIRLALGATPDAIVALVLRGGVLLVGVGVALGIAASLAASRTIRGVLFEVSATNPIIYVAGTIVIVLVAVAATYLPARNASRTDPAQTLRTE
jgi:putative ABC transport system permease protein